MAEAAPQIMTTPTIAVLFQQTTPLGWESLLVSALQKYVDEHLAPAWAVHARLQVCKGTIPAGCWALLFADDSDQAQALGYHELEGRMPVGFVFVKTCTAAGVTISETASHELAEMLLDPGANLAALSPRGRWVAREVCDPVQGHNLQVDGLPMADFVLPSWYGVGDGPFDAAGACEQPWQVLPGGYVPVWDGVKWTAVFGSAAAEAGWRKRGGGEPLKRLSIRCRPPRPQGGGSGMLL